MSEDFIPDLKKDDWFNLQGKLYVVGEYVLHFVFYRSPRGTILYEFPRIAWKSVVRQTFDPFSFFLFSTALFRLHLKTQGGQRADTA